MKTPLLGVITNDPDSVFQRDVIAGMEDVAAQRGYRTMIAQVSKPPSDAGAIGLDFDKLAGALVIANVLPARVLQALAKTGLPLSLISHQAPNIPTVMPNNEQGIAVLMEHLVVACGRTRPVFIRGDMAQNDGIQRDAAFQREVMRYNLDIPAWFYLKGDFVPAVAAESLSQFLARGELFDAVLASDYLLARAAVDVLNAAGLRIPDDVAVVGFGDAPEADEAGLTTAADDIVELGRRGARQLIGQVEGLRIRGVTLLSVALVERATTRRVSAKT